MREVFLNWLDQRTGVPTVFRFICQWSVPVGRGIFNFLPTMIVFAFLTQAITGVLLWSHYSPSAQSAWESLFYMQYVLPGGWMIRGIHHYSAQLLVALLGLYVLGLVFKGRYRSPREFVFWCGIGLLLFSLASCLTGDLLTWTLSGFSATLVRVRFLQMLPWIGEPLFKIVAGGPEFGTLTIPRFLVLHVLIFGGGSFVLMILWRFFDHRAAMVAVPESSTADDGDEPRKSCPTVWTPFWSGDVLKCSLACLVFMMATLLLVYHKPIVNFLRPNAVKAHPHIREASLGAHLGGPADPTGFYDAARPEWSFRALYHFSNLKNKNAEGEEIDVFPGDKKYLPIFVIPGLLFLYIMMIPIIGHSKPGHYFNVIAVACLFLGFCYLTYASYHHDYLDPSMEAFRTDAERADRIAERAVELCLAPAGIPPTGALSLLERDPFLQGPALYEQHCAICHPFHPMDGEPEHLDFKPIICEEPSAPNLYNPIRKKWIAGFLDAKRIRSDDYFGKTKFASGGMVGYVRGTMKEILEDDSEDYEKMLDDMILLLEEEAKRDRPRIETPLGVEDLTKDQLSMFEDFTCNTCHYFYAQNTKPTIQAPDLRGYMSRDWMIGIVADPTSTRFYGPDVDKTKGNDRMPSFYLGPHDATMSLQEIETLVDWLRGKWYRIEDDKTAAPSHSSQQNETKDDPSTASVSSANLKPLEFGSPGIPVN